MYRLMIVDDERSERELVRFLIRDSHLDLEVCEAADGMTALQLLTDAPIDILCTDVQMPGMSGLDLSRKVKELCPEVKIIIFSGYAEFSYAKTAVTLGVENYILKPIEPAEMENTLRGVIAGLDEQRREALPGPGRSDIYRLRYHLHCAVNGWYSRIEWTPDLAEWLGRFTHMLLLSFDASFLDHYMFSLLDDLKIVFGTNLESLSLSAEELLILICDVPQDLPALCGHVCKRIRLKYGHRCRIAVSRPLREYGTAPEPLSVGSGEYAAETADPASVRSGEYAAETVCAERRECRTGPGRTVCVLPEYEPEQKPALADPPARPAECPDYALAFADVESLMEDRFWSPDVSVFSHERTAPAAPSQGSPDDSAQILQIRGALSSHNEARFLELLEPLCRKYAQPSAQSQLYVKFVFSNLLSTMYPYIPAEADGRKASLDDMISSLYTQQDVTEIIAFIRRLSASAARNLNAGEEDIRSEVSGAIRYIREHYAEELSVEKLASVVYLAPDYLSRLFKKSTGISITRYIRQLRMEKAVSLLLETDDKVIDIGAAVGYPNYSYFCQSFREYYGISPDRCRQEERKRRGAAGTGN